MKTSAQTKNVNEKKQTNQKLFAAFYSVKAKSFVNSPAPFSFVSNQLQQPQKSYKAKHNMCWLVLEYICLPVAVFSKQQGVGSVDLPPTDCSPRSAVKINAQTSSEQVDPRWMHRGYKMLESDHRFWRSVSCHCSHVPTSRLLIVAAKRSSSFYHTDYFQHHLHLKAFSLFILQ